MSNQMPNDTVPAAAKGLPKYEIDDVLADASDLTQLLDTLDYFVGELDHGTGENRNQGLERVSLLTRIARDHAERLSANAQTHYGSLRVQAKRRTA